MSVAVSTEMHVRQTVANVGESAHAGMHPCMHARMWMCMHMSTHLHIGSTLTIRPRLGPMAAGLRHLMISALAVSSRDSARAAALATTKCFTRSSVCWPMSF